MAVKSAMRFWQELQPARCARASSGTGTKPSCSRTPSTSLHCMAVCSATRCFGSYFGSAPNTTLRRVCACCVHPGIFCIVAQSLASRLCFRRVAFLPRLLANFFLQQVAPPGSRLVHLLFRVADRTTHDPGNLVVLVALHVVQNKHRAVTRRQLIDRTLQIDAIHGSAQSQIRGPDVLPQSAALFIGLGGFLEGSHRKNFLA